MAEETLNGPDSTGEELTGEDLTEAVIELCRGKAEEFQYLGYEQATWEDVWHCVNGKYAGRQEPPLHRIVNDILTLRVNGFMNYLTLAALKEAPYS
ncbi:post-transcriptional regulator [Saccharibacillus sp. CPCC 101409]|uniref:post-transcriptional regulator n=1 Tax=Saccharibacillus sp. CPCC 101409 TaxID=3058041 RepID=UPI00267254DB|nr:post-transcriptional regulator [Saccharibacillus sp. CPCC 101409]MDO3409003.1 post-transcriptional regulator [Saccharibacillus sp. CPCC 101409]